MSPHHSDQMSQRSQVSRVALFLSSSKVLSESVSGSRSPIELFWRAKTERAASMWFQSFNIGKSGMTVLCSNGMMGLLSHSNLMLRSPQLKAIALHNFNCWLAGEPGAPSPLHFQNPGAWTWCLLARLTRWLVGPGWFGLQSGGRSTCLHYFHELACLCPSV